MVVKWLKKLLDYLENKEKVNKTNKALSSDELEFTEKQRRIKRDFRKMMNYNEDQARGKKER